MHFKCKFSLVVEKECKLLQWHHEGCKKTLLWDDIKEQSLCALSL